FFVDVNDYPWAMVMHRDWKHPLERVRIHDAYPSFSDWVNSKGVRASEWFRAPVSGQIWNP
ncbi:MAG: LruC domain-containing protein, partial [Myxococcota bacterium]